MKTQIISASDPQAIPLALSLLARGELIAFPTDTVYAVGCLVHDAHAIDEIYRVKGRNTMKAIPVLAASLAQVSLLCPAMPEKAARLAQVFWPGALTLVLPKSAGLPANLSPYESVGVRIPNHPFALTLIASSGALAATSANRSGAANPLSAQDVLDQLGGEIALLVDGGPAPGEIPSTVVQFKGEEMHILRQGAIPREALEQALR